MNKETALMRLIMLELSNAGCTVWRNETGGGWVGRVIHRSGHQVTLDSARFIKFGLATGSSDIIGIAPDGRFLAPEVKQDKGRVSPDQIRFIDAVIRARGIAGIVRSVDDALELIKQGQE